MNRRDFNRNLALAALGSGALGARKTNADLSAGSEQQSPGGGAGFKISLMLWTVFTRLPFEQRLEKAASAGYHNVELVGEFEKWSDSEYANANRKRQELGIHFDATGGLRRSLTDPAQRDAFLAEVKGILPAMDKLECPALIILTGNKVPGMSHEAQHASCVEGLKRAGKNVSRERFISGIESIHEMNVGMGSSLILDYGPNDHKGFDNVYPTMVKQGAPVLLTDWSTVGK